MKTVYRTALLGLALFLGCLNAATPYRAKLLHYGWDYTKAGYLSWRHKLMEESMPFDGVMFPLTNEESNITSLWIWDATPWPDDVFDKDLEYLKSCNFQRFTNNFVMTWNSPGPLDWFDDGAWETVAAKYRIVARVAKEAGLKGVCFDPEPYAKFNWNYLPESGHAFDETADIARKRGRQIMAALAAEYPDMTFMAFWLNSFDRARSNQTDWTLYTAFVDGLWDAVPPGMTVVDGVEGGYVVNTQSGALRIAQRVRRDYDAFLSPENRDRYKKQISAGFGFYLDPYVYPVPGWIKLDGTQLVTLFHNMNYLLSAADQYVWFYSEKHRMFVPEEPEISWEAKLPGLDKALRMACHPEAYVAELMQKGAEGAIANHWPNPDFDVAADKALEAPHRDDWKLISTLPGYEAWFEGDNPAISVVDGKLELGAGCVVIAPITVTGGSVYNITIPFQSADGASLYANVGFLNAQGVWVEQDNAMEEAKQPDGDGRQLQLLIGPVPDAAAQMVVIMRHGELPKDTGPVTIVHPSAYCLDDLLPPLADK